ncbi:MAG: alanine racemase, partial [Bacteroidetes bacterium]
SHDAKDSQSTPRHRKIMAIIKRDAYGHGMRRIAKALEDWVDMIGLATVDEGIDLRMAGVRKPILILAAPNEQTAAAYVTHNLIATISDEVHFSMLMDGTRYHLEFDTGMRRLGFRPEEAVRVRQQAMIHRRLVCAGIFSHYATSQDPGSSLVAEQNRAFQQVLTHFPEVSLRHMSNSGGILFYGGHIEHFSMIRTGIGLMGYGAGHTQPGGLHPVKLWRSRIVQTQEVRAGESVSYGATWRAERDGFIAVVPVGYADGIPRALSNRLEVAIHGRRYPIAGVVTMDYIMIDLGEERIMPRTEVTILGGEAMDARDWAELAGSNIHEILTNAGREAERIYLHE